MDVHDELTLVPPTLNTPNRAVMSNAMADVSPLPNFVTRPTVSPASRLDIDSIMQQQENSRHFANAADDSKDKAALSFILSSSDSDSETDGASSYAVVKRKRSIVSSASGAAAPVRKGSKFCTVEGCTSRAKHAKRCWKHGGSVKCKISDCINRAKSKGVCWSHGGGTVCSADKCDTIAVSNGFCWAHGGGKRCQVLHCSKPAYERTQNYCQTHYEELNAAGTG